MTIELIWEPLNPDLDRWTKEFKKGMERLWKAAIGEFVTSIVLLDMVPVDTGMSLASLHDAAVVARIWGDVKSAIIFKRKNTRRKGLTEIDGNYDKSRFREIKEGIAAASKATSISFDLPRLEFNFSIEVFQWWFWEIKQGRWTSLEPAADAFIKFINENWEQYVPGLEALIA